MAKTRVSQNQFLQGVNDLLNIVLGPSYTHYLVKKYNLIMIHLNRQFYKYIFISKEIHANKT